MPRSAVARHKLKLMMKPKVTVVLKSVPRCRSSDGRGHGDGQGEGAIAARLPAWRSTSP